MDTESVQNLLFPKSLDGIEQDENCSPKTSTSSEAAEVKKQLEAIVSEEESNKQLDNEEKVNDVVDAKVKIDDNDQSDEQFDEQLDKQKDKLSDKQSDNYLESDKKPNNEDILLSTNSSIDKKESQESENSNSDSEFEVEIILDKRKRRRTVEYFLKWKNYSIKECSWEPEEHLNCQDLIQEFEERHKKKRLRKSSH